MWEIGKVIGWDLYPLGCLPKLQRGVQFNFILFLFLLFIGCLMYLAICSGYVYLCITFVSVPFILSYGVIGNNCGCGSSRSYIFPFCSVSFPILDVEIASYVRFWLENKPLLSICPRCLQFYFSCLFITKMRQKNRGREMLG